MDQNKANTALAAVETKYAEWLAFDNAKGTEYGPKIVRGFYADNDWCIVWEQNSPDNWAINWNEDPAGIFMEPIYSFALGVYDA